MERASPKFFFAPWDKVQWGDSTTVVKMKHVLFDIQHSLIHAYNKIKGGGTKAAFFNEVSVHAANRRAPLLWRTARPKWKGDAHWTISDPTGSQGTRSDEQLR